MSIARQVGLVIIGRNEGARLLACLASIKGEAERVVYVDSGSTDGSQEAARQAGADVVVLDTDQPFTAARARNAGFKRLEETGLPEFVQFVDGDCVLREGWLCLAADHLDTNPQVAVVCGRRRERFPEASLYNRMIDAEWDTPVGLTKACGGDAMIRSGAFKAVRGFNASLIAGEEPELCVRLRQAGWSIYRLDAEMTWHDAALSRFSQWWHRSRRAGHAFAEGAALHGAPPERHWVLETRRALVWGAVLPFVILLGTAFVTPWALVLSVIWVVKIIRLMRQGFNRARAVFLTLGNIPEALGVLSYYWRARTGGKAQLIEYK